MATVVPKRLARSPEITASNSMSDLVNIDVNMLQVHAKQKNCGSTETF